MKKILLGMALLTATAVQAMEDNDTTIINNAHKVMVITNDSLQQIKVVGKDEDKQYVYENLLQLMADKDYFVITTNVDHMFQKAGFDKKRLFYTQGDYGLFQNQHPTVQKTWDNEEWVMQAMAAQGFVKNTDGSFVMPEDGKVAMRIPTVLIPRSPEDERKVMPNLRSDDSFVEDEGWHRASAAYANYLRQHQGQHVLYLEIGVGSNTPVIIKYPFWQMTNDNPNAVYCCLNYDEAYCPKQIEARSICIDGDTGTLLREWQ